MYAHLQTENNSWRIMTADNHVIYRGLVSRPTAKYGIPFHLIMEGNVGFYMHGGGRSLQNNQHQIPRSAVDSAK